MEARLIEVWALTLTSLNLLSAGLVIGFVFFDNHRGGWRGWIIPPERRTPISVAIAVFAANVIFCVREVGEMDVLNKGEVADGPSSRCAGYNELSWLGIHRLLNSINEP